MHRSWKQAGQLLCLGILMAWAGPQARAEDFLTDCFNNCCPKFHCPRIKHCIEGAPRFHFSCACPKPYCNPCNQPNWGYYQTCWTPFPWQHNWSHCPVPPPASMVNPGLPTEGYPGMLRGPQGQPEPGGPLPTPRALERPPL